MAEKKEEAFKFYPDSSPNELKEFMQTHIWRDMERYVSHLFDGSMIQLKTSLDHRLVLRSQGAIEAAEDFLNLPNLMIEWAEEDDELNSEEEE